MAGGGRLKVGLTVRNVTEPSFSIADESEALKLQRQARAGVAFTPVDGWAVAADFDLLSTGSPDQVRSFAMGTEGRIGSKVFVRSGFRLNTTGSARPSVAAGGSLQYLAVAARGRTGDVGIRPSRSRLGNCRPRGFLTPFHVSSLNLPILRHECSRDDDFVLTKNVNSCGNADSPA